MFKKSTTSYTQTIPTVGPQSFKDSGERKFQFLIQIVDYVLKIEYLFGSLVILFSCFSPVIIDRS